MGINDLLKELPGGDAKVDTRSNLSSLTLLRSKNQPIDFDVGTLIYTCAFKHKVSYAAGNYIPAVREFQARITILRSLHQWDFTCIFDGIPPPEKAYEHERRRRKEEGIAITSTYIAMCAKVCQRCFIPYIVSPVEADMQVGRRRENAVAVCRDSDLVAYGRPKVVIVDSWSREEYRYIDMETPVTEEIEAKYPLYVYIRQYGLRIVHWWAAVMGCDVSKGPTKVGIRGVGRAAFLEALTTFDSKQERELSARSFAKALRDKAGSTVRLSYSIREIQAELNRVSHWFSSGGSYYDGSGNIKSFAGIVIKKASRTLVEHMNGRLDPKSGAAFTPEQEQQRRLVEPHNLLHNSAAKRGKIKGISLPEGKTTLDNCNKAEMKAMIVARGGSVTGKDGKGLSAPVMQRTLEAYLHLERQRPTQTVYFDRSRSQNGIFAKIDTREKRTVTQMLDALVKCTEFEDSLANFFNDLQRYCSVGKFIVDFGTIALAAPEMEEAFINKSFVHVGNSTSQKNITSGLTRVLEMNDRLYHGVAWADDGKSIYIMSKQRASQKHDETTRQKTAVGERPLLQEYLVMCQVAVQPTTNALDGHTLGRCTHVMRSYCAACKAGCGMCYHRAGLCWMQHLHWGEGRPTPRPSTVSYAPWIPGSRAKRECSTIVPAAELHIERLPRSNQEAKEREERGTKKNIHSGIAARYDVHGGDEKKKALLDDPRYTSKERVKKLFQCLRAASSANTGGGSAGAGNVRGL